MGIREHFEKHPEELKLQDLSVEQEQTDSLVFDPERDLTEDDWKAMLKELSGWKENTLASEYLTHAFYIKIIKPNFEEKLVENSDLPKIRKSLKNEQQQRVWWNFSAHIMNIINLRPDKASEFRQMAQEVWSDLETELENKKTDGFRFAGQAAYMKIIRPDFQPQIDEPTWELIKQQLEDYRNKRKWYKFAWLAVRMKISQPDRINELGLDKKTWQELKKSLNAFREPNKRAWGFSAMTMCLTVLAAEKVKITDQGLKLTMPKQDFKQQKTKRPERRQF